MVLMAAGIAKVRDPFLAARFLNALFAVSFSDAVQITYVLAWFEVALSIALACALLRSRVPALLALALFGTFIGLLLRLVMMHPNAATCGCFGSLFQFFPPAATWTQLRFDILICACLAANVFSLPRNRTMTDASRSLTVPHLLASKLT
jgi:hypothetical protein